MPKILRSAYGRGGPIKALSRFTLRQEFGRHTLALLDYQFTKRADYVLPAENVPVQVQWGESPLGVRTFYGYVNHYETHTDRTGVYTRMVTLGTSKTFDSAEPRSWSGTTRSSMARDLARKHKLRSVVHEHDHVVEHWTTGSRTDTEVLRAWADESGFLSWVDGSTLYFLDPEKVLSGADRMMIPRITAEAVRSAEIFGGSNVPGYIPPSKRVRFYGLDSNTNELIETAAGDPTAPTSLAGGSITSYSDVAEYVSASFRKESDFYLIKIRVNGDARIMPGGLVNVEPGTVNTDQAGVWFVRSAEHVLTPDEFFTTFTATRGKEHTPLFRTRTTVRDTTISSQAVVRDGQHWEAALQEHVYV